VNHRRSAKVAPIATLTIRWIPSSIPRAAGSDPSIRAPSTQAVEVTGPIEVELWASSSATDTDFFVRILDVHPDGKAYNLMSPTLEVLRARYRASETKPIFLEPGRIERFRLRNMMTSNLFKVGHRIRVHVTSSFFPHLDRNPNTGDALGVSNLTEKAKQAIYHDVDHPSRIVLPVIPR